MYRRLTRPAEQVLERRSRRSREIAFSIETLQLAPGRVTDAPRRSAVGTEQALGKGLHCLKCEALPPYRSASA